RVGINGESWGIYVNTQQFNKDFVKEWFGTTKGARWKTPGSPGGRASLAYLCDVVTDYKRIYQIKSKDDPKAWTDLIKLCKVLNETPADHLEEALAPILDIDGALKFLALDNALINNDGYWVRTSDYSLYQDTQGRFHVLPQDSNETFARPGGPGGGRGGFGPAMFIGPGLFTATDANKDGSVTRAEFKDTFAKWFAEWDAEKSGSLTGEKLRTGLGTALPQPNFGGPGGGFAGL